MSGIESAVRERYAQASQQHESCLCVPSNGYDPRYLKVLPDEIIQRDYGCGDRASGSAKAKRSWTWARAVGKSVTSARKKWGPNGRVIGVDFNQPMLDLARKHQESIGDRLGYHNVEFRKGKIQDLKLDLELFETWLNQNPASDADGYLRAQDHAEALSRQRPMIADESIDVIVSNCVLNLVAPQQKTSLFAEMFRVLKSTGRCVISDVVCDEDVPRELADDPKLWSGCISGAFREDLFLAAFEEAGFHGCVSWSDRISRGRRFAEIEFRSITVEAFKGKLGPCFEHNQAVIYKGPWKRVVDGRRPHAGARSADGGVRQRRFRCTSASRTASSSALSSRAKRSRPRMRNRLIVDPARFAIPGRPRACTTM
jgi:SAM-dependent methyltransferase